MGARLKGRRPQIPSIVRRLVIYFCLKDLLVRVETSNGDCPVGNPADAEPKTACLEELFLDSAVDRRSGTPPLPAMVVGASIFGMIFPISLIVFHAIMFMVAITNPGFDLTLDKGMGRLYPGMESLLMSFLSSTG